ncbi:PadR family transcriptional regulator [Pseudoxanthobacter sp.]|uniref:PadR family transcriptional regulator n=1 Tax=Pseudoxanthobacter sp. TaxID=1925742 RepID=UPI002FE1B78F
MVLWLIGEKPSHGYELIKSIEAQAGGAYSPSPGTIYPALAFLEDRGYVQAEEPAGSRRLFAITPAGRAYLAASREQVEALFGRIREHRTAEPDVPAPVMRAMENLTLALRMRLERGLLSPAEAHAIAGILDQAAQSVERT